MEGVELEEEWVIMTGGHEDFFQQKLWGNSWVGHDEKG